jgi:glycosyl-4,4'-diaponeurosporenoate acyltransferase
VPIDLPIAWIIVLNVAGWPIIQFGLAWGFTRLPAAWFKAPASWSWERGGHFYERVLGVRRWKHRLPDAARWFAGGFPKSKLAGRDATYLRQFIRETWRGELCHWFALAWAPVFFLWNPWWADLIMVGYGLSANLPCIIAQRYNRARFQRLIAKKV